MDDADLLREALEALKDPTLNIPELQARIAARLAAIYGGGGPAPTVERADEEPLDATIPILPSR
jgi:hypothetical protein